MGIERPDGPYAAEMTAGPAWPDLDETVLDSDADAWETDRKAMEAQLTTFQQSRVRLFEGAAAAWSGMAANAANAKHRSVIEDLQAQERGSAACVKLHRDAAGIVISTKQQIVGNVENAQREIAGVANNSQFTAEQKAYFAQGMVDRTHAENVKLVQAGAAMLGKPPTDRLSVRPASTGHDMPQAPPPDHPDEGGKITPPDQLPLPAKGGQTPSPTEATRDNTSPDVSRHLVDNPNPSPLIAGLSAQEWRERLAHFHPGDPLPDPRTPTGDPAIDTLAHAAGQQNTTYAWGGNQSPNGPTRGVPDGGDADSKGDTRRIGYDCGGLVRYSVQQGAGFDVDQGTNNIDRNRNFQHGAGNVPSADINNSVASPGDVVVFGNPGHQPFTGAGTDEHPLPGTHHTGIYIGNGYYINAPESGMPVEVDNLKLRTDSADILKVPGR